MEADAKWGSTLSNPDLQRQLIMQGLRPPSHEHSQRNRSVSDSLTNLPRLYLDSSQNSLGSQHVVPHERGLPTVPAG